ncbi:unnamed protein product [Musa banksii]
MFVDGCHVSNCGCFRRHSLVVELHHCQGLVSLWQLLE